MSEWKVAPTYKNWELKGVDEYLKKALVSTKCDRCGGTGIWGSYVVNNHLAGVCGPCFKCNGSGTIDKWVKAYTEEEYERYVKNQEKQKQRRIAAEVERKEELVNNSEENKKELLSKWGYDPENPTIYLIGGDTYGIKDELKTNGCRFCKEFGWYSTSPLEIELDKDKYFIATINFNDVYDWFPLSRNVQMKENAKEIADAALMAAAPASESDWVGEEKERLRDLKVTCTAVRHTDGYYGTTTIYTFDYNKNILVWMTSSAKDINEGDSLLLTGTVKEHSLYKGKKQTKLSRCIVKEVE